MNRKEEYPVERFTNEEIEVVTKVAKVVCHVFNITDEQLRSDSRRRPMPDARKVLSHYVSNNIKLEKFSGPYHVALATWYLKKDHSTICTAVNEADNLYQTDIVFRHNYDSVINIINDLVRYELIFCENPELLRPDLTWDMVKRNSGYENVIKAKLIPKKVSDRLKEMYQRGYAITQIAYDIRTTVAFVNFYVKTNNIERGPIKINIVRKQFDAFSAPIRPVSTKIDY